MPLTVTPRTGVLVWGMADYTVSVAGESFRNADGSDRQEEIGRCRVGEPVTLEREPDNPYDGNCVKVISARGVQIGNVSRDAPWIAERLDAGRRVDAVIGYIGEGGKNLGVVLDVTTREPGEPPAQIHTAAAGTPPPSRGLSNGCAAAIVIALLLLILALAMGDRARPPGAASSTSPRPSLAKITRDEFERIAEGQTYSEVQAIVGEPGELLSSSDIGGLSTRMYGWTNWDGSNANIMVQGGRVVMKAQFGL